MNRQDFVTKCGELLRIAKPHLVGCEYKIGKDLPQTELTKVIETDEYAVITCENGCTYNVNITADSLMLIAIDIFQAMEYK
jgi:hypothetical protein